MVECVSCYCSRCQFNRWGSNEGNQVQGRSAPESPWMNWLRRPAYREFAYKSILNLKSKMRWVTFCEEITHLFQGFRFLTFEMTQLYTCHTLGYPKPSQPWHFRKNSWEGHFWHPGFQGTNLGTHTFIPLCSWPIRRLAAPWSEMFHSTKNFVGPTRLSKQRGSKDLRFLAQKWRYTLEAWTHFEAKGHGGLEDDFPSQVGDL